MFVRSDVRGSLKQHMLEQVCKACSANALVRGSNVVPEIDRYNRSSVIFGKRDKEAIVETKRRNRDLHVIK